MDGKPFFLVLRRCYGLGTFRASAARSERAMVAPVAAAAFPAKPNRRPARGGVEGQHIC
jgi:hypothetical protein